jgi:hypothetical protein
VLFANFYIPSELCPPCSTVLFLPQLLVAERRPMVCGIGYIATAFLTRILILNFEKKEFAEETIILMKEKTGPSN